MSSVLTIIPKMHRTPAALFLSLLFVTPLLLEMGCAPSSRSTTPLQTIAARPATPPQRPQPLFREVGKEAGLDYVWKIPGKRPLTILQTIGNGCAFFDANGDGNLDILL